MSIQSRDVPLRSPSRSAEKVTPPQLRAVSILRGQLELNHQTRV